MPKDDLTIVTTDEVPGYRIVKILGLVRASKGHNVRSEAAAAENATRQMQQLALARGANVVVGFRMAVSESLVYAYGTAVVVEASRVPGSTGPAESTVVMGHGLG